MTRRHIVCLALGGILVLGGMFLACSYAFIAPPETGELPHPAGGVLRDGAGAVMRVALGPGDADCRPYYAADPGDWIVKALVAAEDATFWEHHGVRPLSALRAAAQNVMGGRRVSGASTLTMQAVRLRTPHPKSLWEKWKEMVRAVRLERARSKLWILTEYLNRAPFGSNFVGIEAAANGWFAKGAKDLGPGEAALLAGMVQAPSRFRPDRALEKALARREYVLAQMVRTGVMTREQAELARTVRPAIARAARPFRHPYFCDWAMRSEGANTNGLDRVTTLVPETQRIAEDAVRAAAAVPGRSAAAVVLRVLDSAVTAMACSGNYFTSAGGQVNTAVAPRPAGSTLKPFLVARALDAGRVTPATRLLDVPMAFKGYRPANFDARNRGLVSLADALVLSLNLPFVRLLQETGVEHFATTLRAAGFRHLRDDASSYGLGMAIGNVEVTLVELAGAYAALARGGTWMMPTAFPERSGTEREMRVCSRAAAYLVASMLSGDERRAAALGHVADVAAPSFAWKTGTSAGGRDAWTIAWNPETVVAVWCGDASGGTAGGEVTGIRDAAPHVWRIIRALYPQNDARAFEKPAEVVAQTVCAESGWAAGPDCPETEAGMCIAGVSGTSLCPRHVRDANGRVVVREDPSLAAFRGGAAKKLVLAEPTEGTVYRAALASRATDVVCKVHGNPEGGRVWWFLDGVPQGETKGAEPFVVHPAVGEHTASCATMDGVAAMVRFKVEATCGAGLTDEGER